MVTFIVWLPAFPLVGATVHQGTPLFRVEATLTTHAVFVVKENVCSPAPSVKFIFPCSKSIMFSDCFGALSFSLLQAVKNMHNGNSMNKIDIFFSFILFEFNISL